MDQKPASSSKNIDGQDKDGSQPTEQTLGQKIIALREAQGLSIGDVAERLKLSVKQVEALEKDNFDYLPGLVFARGFFRSYAKLLKMDEKEINANLDTYMPVEELGLVKKSDFADVNYSSPAMSETTSSGGGKWLLLGLVILAAIFGLYLLLSGGKQQDVDPDLGAVGVTSEVYIGDEVVSEPIVLENSEALTSSEAITPSEVILGDNAQESIDSKGKLVIVTGYKTYLTITDKNGNILMNQKLVPANSVHAFPADAAPYAVKIGYASNSKVEFNGKSIEINDKIKKKTLEMVIPE